MNRAFDTKLRSARLRCALNVLLEQAARVLVILGAGAALAVVLDRSLAVQLPVLWIVWAFCGLGVAATALLWMLNFPTRMQVALLADERLGFHERFSSALLFAATDDPFAKAAVDEARDAAQRVSPEKHFPVRPRRSWIFAAGTWAVVGAAVLLLPSMDLLGSLRRRQDQQDKKKKLDQAKAEVTATLSRVESAVKQLHDAKLAKELADLSRTEGVEKPEALRRQAIRKLGNLADKLKERRKELNPEAADRMKNMLAQLRSVPKSVRPEMQRALARGDLAEVSKILDELRRQLADGKLSDADKQALAREMKNLAEQLNKLSERQKAEFAEELKKLGLDGDLASLNDEDLREALKKAGLTEEQIDDLMDKLSQCKLSSSRLSALSEAMGSCSGGMGKLSAGELMELAELLDEMGSLDGELALSEATLDEIADAIALLGQGGGAFRGFRPGQSDVRGPGTTGGPGRGFGLDPIAEDKKAVAAKKTRVKNKSSEGPIIASSHFRGQQIKGKSKRKFTQTVQAGRDRASEAISDKRIPKKYEGSVKKYFDQMEKLGNK